MIVVAPTRLRALDYCRVLAGRRVETGRVALTWDALLRPGVEFGAYAVEGRGIGTAIALRAGDPGSRPEGS
jgi:hypothetical protein